MGAKGVMFEKDMPKGTIIAVGGDPAVTEHYALDQGDAQGIVDGPTFRRWDCSSTD